MLSFLNFSSLRCRYVRTSISLPLRIWIPSHRFRYLVTSSMAFQIFRTSSVLWALAVALLLFHSKYSTNVVLRFSFATETFEKLTMMRRLPISECFLKAFHFCLRILRRSSSLPFLTSYNTTVGITESNTGIAVYKFSSDLVQVQVEARRLKKSTSQG